LEALDWNGTTLQLTKACKSYKEKEQDVSIINRSYKFHQLGNDGEAIWIFQSKRYNHQFHTKQYGEWIVGLANVLNLTFVKDIDEVVNRPQALVKKHMLSTTHSITPTYEKDANIGGG